MSIYSRSTQLDIENHLSKKFKRKLTEQECHIMTDNEEYYTLEQASQHAIEYCEKHKGWKRICDIEDLDKLYYDWVELGGKEKNFWIREYGKHSAEDAWREFGRKKCKAKVGFISGKGEFYDDVLKVPRFHNLMQIFKTT